MSVEGAKVMLGGLPRLNTLKSENGAVLPGCLGYRGPSSEGAEVRLGLGQGDMGEREAPPGM